MDIHNIQKLITDIHNAISGYIHYSFLEISKIHGYGYPKIGYSNDNSEIIFFILYRFDEGPQHRFDETVLSHQAYVVTPHLNHLNEIVLIRGENISFIHVTVVI